MTDNEILEQIAEALAIDREQLSMESSSNDFPEDWDSMGTFGLITMLESEFGVKLEPGQTEQLQSVAGVFSLLRKAGKIS